QPRRSAPYATTAATRSARLLFYSRRRRTSMTSSSLVCYANIPSGTSGRTHTERYSAVQPAGFGKIGMTIEEAADYTGIGRNTLRRLVDWGKIPVLRIGRKSIVRSEEHTSELQSRFDLVCRLL